MWTSYSGADNEKSGQLAQGARALEDKLVPLLNVAQVVATADASWVAQAGEYRPGESESQLSAAQREYHEVRHQFEASHPMALAYNLDPFAPGTSVHLARLGSATSADRAEAVGEELETRLRNIARVRKAASEDRQYVWKLDRIIGTTRELPDIKHHALLTHPGVQSRVVIDKVADVKFADELVSIGAGVVMFGLGLVAAAPTGGLSVAGVAAVSAAGMAESAIAVATAYRSFDLHQLESAAGATDYDQAKALSADTPGLFWLALRSSGPARRRCMASRPPARCFGASPSCARRRSPPRPLRWPTPREGWRASPSSRRSARSTSSKLPENGLSPAPASGCGLRRQNPEPRAPRSI